MTILTNKIKTAKFSRNKITSIAVAIFLIFSMTASLMFLPSANAHSPPWTYPTSAYVTCAPGTIGLGQYTTIVVWLDRFSPTVGGIQGQLWDGYKLNITKPDGSIIIIGPWTCASDVASDFKTFTPDEVGTYTIVFSWPGETVTNGTGIPLASGIPAVGDFFEGATSKPCTLTVQQTPVPNWQEPALPTDYWTLPINGANRGWSTLASNWLLGSWLVNSFQYGGTVPLSAHVLWSQPITPGRAGGIADAQWPGIPADVNDYESPWSAPIIMNGIIYYNAPSVADSDQYGYYAMSLYTGQQLWYKNGTDNGLNNPYTMIAPGGGGAGGPPDLQSYLKLTQGQLYYYYSVNGQGVLSYLIMVSGTTWYFLDASTGNWMFTLTNVPAGTAVTDNNGDLLRYSYNAATGNILCWNSSQSIRPAGPSTTAQQQWKPPLGSIINAVNDTTWTQYGPSLPSDQNYWSTNDVLPRSGYTMNVTSASLAGLPGSITTVLQNDDRVPEQIFGSLIVSTGGSGPAGAVINSAAPDADTFSAWLVDINYGVTGYSPSTANSNTQANNLGFGATLIMNKNIAVPLPGLNYTWSIKAVDYDSQTFELYCTQTSQAWTYSLTTGALLWGPTTSFNQMDYYGLTDNVYYGKLIQCSSYGGWLAAYNITNGNLLWTYNATATSPYESAYGNNMPLSLTAICDGTAITYSTEHSPTKPLWRDSYVRCVNLTDGTLMWKLLDFNMGLSVADGYIVTGSQYDNNVYCIGKGPSATTVQINNGVTSLGSSVMIKGTVTDQSPGAKAVDPKFGYTNGVPAVSDASQEGWMEYLYEQQAMPTDTTGVQVSLAAIDPNGNYVSIGTVNTTDITGAYGCMFTPQVPGTYHIIATFAGSNSYSGSSSDTYLGVNQASATPAPTAVPLSASAIETSLMSYVIVAAIAIIIAVAIATILILRKHA